jgi:hypothetical protein
MRVLRERWFSTLKVNGFATKTTMLVVEKLSLFDWEDDIILKLPELPFVFWNE